MPRRRLPWFRLFDEMLDDPKVQLLSDAVFRDWINLLCLANREKERGTLPEIGVIAFALRKSDVTVDVTLHCLLQVGLVERYNENRYRITNWEDRQKRTDTSADRVKKHRDAAKNGGKLQDRPRCNVTRNVTVTDVKRSCNGLDIDKEEENTPLIIPPLDDPASPVASLGPEYAGVARYAEEQGGDVSWAIWSDRMGRAGHSARDIRDAIDMAAGSGNLHQAYVAKILRGWAKGGRPKEQPRRNAPTPAVVTPPPTVRADPESTHPMHRTEAQHRAVAAKWGVSLDDYFARIGYQRERTA